MGINQTKTVVRRKENYQQNEKTAHSMRGDTCKQHIWEVSLQNAQVIHTTQQQTDSLIRKCQGLNRHSFQRRHTDGQQGLEKWCSASLIIREM